MLNKTTLLLIVLSILIILSLIYIVGVSIINTSTKPATILPPIIFSPGPTSSSQPNIFDRQFQQQTEADNKYIELQNKVLQEFPWYNKLPLQAENYFVLFDLSKKAFRAKIYPQKTAATSIDDQTKAYQQEITQKLKELGIDTSKYQIEWSINPE